MRVLCYAITFDVLRKKFNSNFGQYGFSFRLLGGGGQHLFIYLFERVSNNTMGVAATPKLCQILTLML